MLGKFARGASDASTGAVLGSFSIAGSGQMTALGGDGVGGLARNPEPRVFAVPADQSNQIAELDPLTGAELRRIPAPEPVSGGPDGLCYNGSSLYYINGSGTDTLWQLDPDTGAVLDSDSITAGSGNYDGLAWLDGKVYVLDFGNGDILQFDPLSDTVTRTLDINGLNPGVQIVGGLAGITGPDGLLVTDLGNSRLLEIDPTTGLVRGSFAVSGTYYGLALVGQDIWLGDGNKIDVPMKERTELGRKRGRCIEIAFIAHAKGLLVELDQEVYVAVRAFLAARI